MGRYVTEADMDVWCEKTIEEAPHSSLKTAAEHLLSSSRDAQRALEVERSVTAELRLEKHQLGVNLHLERDRIAALESRLAEAEVRAAAAEERAREAEARVAALESALREAWRTVRGIANINRFDREAFDDAAAFADWAQSRARLAAERIESTLTPPLPLRGGGKSGARAAILRIWDPALAGTAAPPILALACGTRSPPPPPRRRSRRERGRAMGDVTLLIDYATTDLPLSVECCPHCGGTIFEEGFGLAGGGFGPYQYCANPNCNRLVSKQPLPEDES